jgi:hypothetical protein
MTTIAFNAAHRMRPPSPEPSKQKDFIMTMLTPTRSRYEQAAYSSGNRNRIGAGGAGARLAKVRRFFVSVLWVVMACVALTAIMALKVIVYLPHFHT